MRPIKHANDPTERDSTLSSPVNQVFQFMYGAACSSWSDGSTNQATAYLWIPEECERLRGLLIMCANVPEHRLVGHPGVRRVCASNALGIVWCVPSFMNWAKQQPGKKKMSEENSTTTAFLQQLLNGLAQNSGYDEVATVPWLPMGESGHLLMVDALVEEKPDRCIAGIWIKNSHLPPKNRQTPALVVYGTAQEWGQDKIDIRNNWNRINKTYEGILTERKNNPGWPLSYLIDGHSGHFDCSERLTRYIARYIDLVSAARLSNDGSPTLKRVDLEQGYLADLPIPGHEGMTVVPATKSAALPWFFNEASAKEAQRIASINWDAETQLPAFLDDKGKPLPFLFNGIADLNLKSVEMEADGITFHVRGTVLDRIPDNFVGAGEKLAKAPGEPEAEWLCGPVAPLGNGKFRISLDRTWLANGTTYLALRQKGTDNIRGGVQPMRIDLKRMRNTDGKEQTIRFDKIADVPAGTESIPLRGISDAGLPVEFFVVAGPAMVMDGNLIFTPIPPRTKWPIEVTVAAWQWGKSTESTVNTAEVVKQIFKIRPA